MNHSLITCPNCSAKNRIPYDKLHLSPKCGRCGQSLAGKTTGAVVELTDADLQSSVKESSLPVLVDFYSPTCGPCRTLAPVIETVARTYAGRVLVGKLDTSRHQRSAAAYQIRGVPTLLLFKQGKVIEQIVGAVPQVQIEQALNAHL